MDRNVHCLHHSHHHFFRHPFGAVPIGTQLELRLEVTTEQQPAAVMARLWLEGREEKLPMEQMEAEGHKVVYQVQLHVPAKAGLLWYYFMLQWPHQVLYYGNNSQQLGGEGQLVAHEPPSYQVTVYNREANTPHWFKEAVMYQIFVDRFYNGREDGQILNPKPGALIHSHWHDDPIYIRDEKNRRVVRWDFFGGNLLGVIKKLPYLKELGIDVIYLNPIFKSPSNHKYDTADYKAIDEMFGDEETYQTLCRVAEEMGISIILDGVFSHTGSDSIYFNKEGNYPQIGAYQSPDSPYYQWFIFHNYPDQYESWWGIETMPNVNELEESYQHFILNEKDGVVPYWMKLGAKGWRLDVVDELPDEFVKKIYKQMKQENEQSVLIGEVWEDASNKQSYGETREYLLGDELDSVMNYPWRQVLLDFFLMRTDGERTHQRLMSLYENYPLQHFYSTMNFLGTHDTARILTIMGEGYQPEDLSDNELAKVKLSSEQLQLGLKRLKLLFLWQMTFPGVPCIYYGDEAGLEGQRDPLCRRPYPWGRENKELVQWCQKLISLRRHHPCLTTGAWVPLITTGDVYSYLRVITGGKDVFGQEQPNGLIVVVINRHPTETVTVELNLSNWHQEQLTDVLADDLHQSTLKVEHGLVQFSLAPLSGKILKGAW